ncbi:TolC family protein [Neorhodopirellula pilleata]|nr:TolC family protein [Neorhodopirellula pilleata]
MLALTTGCHNLPHADQSAPEPTIYSQTRATSNAIRAVEKAQTVAANAFGTRRDINDTPTAETSVNAASPIALTAFDESTLDESLLERATLDDVAAPDPAALDIEPIVLQHPQVLEQAHALEQPVVGFDAMSTGMTLEAIEAIALSNNPTIAELVATTQKAAGFRHQVGLWANPTLGYNATQLADEGTDQHTVFISQTLITADKLALNRSVLNEALRAQLLQLEAQKYRIATDVRITFYEALAAQRRIELIRDFRSVVDKGLDIAEQLKEAEEGSQLEVVQAKVQKNEIELALKQAEIRYQAAWRELAAFAGNPGLAPMPLHGNLPNEEPSLDWSDVAASTTAASPEYQAALARVSQARANLCRQQVQPIPNLDVQLASGYDNGTNSGLINLQIGAPIPVFNKNQGNIAAARAEYMRASREVERIENSIQARLAAVSREYDSSLAAVQQYASDILPNAEEGLNLAELAYQAGETSFVQVLVARRTYFDTNLQYIRSQAQLAQAKAQVDGFVLTGALDSVVDNSGDDSLRGLTLGQQ